MNEGIVKFFNQTKGFGFIREENSGTEYFVHATGLIDKVRENDRVNFELKEGRQIDPGIIRTLQPPLTTAPRGGFFLG
jgi:CspA family cold shock protein